MLISPFGMSPKAMVGHQSPVKAFSLEHEEDDGYESAQSDGVDQLLSGNWKPNYDVAIDEDETPQSGLNGADMLLPTVMDSIHLVPEIQISTKVAVEVTQVADAKLKYSEEDVTAMKAQWMAEARAELEASQLKHAATAAELNSMKSKEEEYVALITEYEATVTALEADKSTRDTTSMEAYARQLSELELANTRLRTERSEMEASFQQLHKRYEQLKTLQGNAVKNEGILKQTLSKSQADFMAAEARFLRLKNHAQTQLDAANAEINRIREESIKKNLLLAAKLSRCQTQLASLQVEHSLVQSENQTLQSVVAELCASLHPSSSNNAMVVTAPVASN
jgi:hypothetical protein